MRRVALLTTLCMIACSGGSEGGSPSEDATHDSTTIEDGAAEGGEDAPLDGDDGALSDSPLPDSTSDVPAPDGGDAGPSCGAIPSWADGAKTTRDVHVKAGAAAGGDGTSTKPFATLDAGLKALKPGDRLIVHAGTYAGGAYSDTLKGTAEKPIVITGAEGEATPKIQGSAQGLHLTDASYVVLQDLEVFGQSANAINVDDGGTFDTPAHHLVFRRLYVHDVASGNHDGIKLSGVTDSLVIDSRFEKIGGQMVDMVGCHRMVVARNTFKNGETFAVQMKGGSADDVVTRNWFENAGLRGVNMGGSTGLEFFRPKDAPHEAARIVVSANVFVGGDTPFAYVGCDACTAVHNTIVRPVRWAARILQETVGTRFVPCRKGKFQNNLVIVATGISGETVNVGANTEPSSFVFSNNLWFHTSNPSFKPTLPVTETASIYGVDPKLVDLGKPDPHLQPTSPAIGKGLDLGATVPGDRDGRCWEKPPAIGAHEK